MHITTKRCKVREADRGASARYRRPSWSRAVVREAGTSSAPCG